MPNPFSGFFDDVGDKQRGGADECAQRVADYIIHLRHAESVAVLDVLNPRAENATDKRREGDSNPAVPLLRQCIGQRQPLWEEEKHVHQHLAVEFRLLPRGGEGGKGGEDKHVIAGCAG